jgi:hypothetical protein
MAERLVFDWLKIVISGIHYSYWSVFCTGLGRAHIRVDDLYFQDIVIRLILICNYFQRTLYIYIHMQPFRPTELEEAAMLSDCQVVPPSDPIPPPSHPIRFAKCLGLGSQSINFVSKSSSRIIEPVIA